MRSPSIITPENNDPSVCSGFSRRNFLRLAGAASALASISGLTEAHLAYAQRPARPKFADPNIGIHIDANENPLGPSDPARKAIADMTPKGGRYEFPLQLELIDIFAKQEGLSPDSVMAYAGSGEPLQYTVLAFTSKDRPLVTADVTFEAPWWAATSNNAAQIIKVPLADPKGCSHPRSLRLCSQPPQIPASSTSATQTTRPAPLPRLQRHRGHVVANAPKDTTHPHRRGLHSSLRRRALLSTMVKEGKNVIVLRTFSKLYGMAGLRLRLCHWPP